MTTIQFTSSSRCDQDAEFMVDLGDFPGTVSLNMIGVDGEAWANVPIQIFRDLAAVVEELAPRALAGEVRDWR